ncbi:MAG TPA: lipoyl synthase [Candidatus Nanoarchaeia archaeon]|nr:lipoyl synthase [Candidatus Nanoarchaeia archaeon]
MCAAEQSECCTSLVNLAKEVARQPPLILIAVKKEMQITIEELKKPEWMKIKAYSTEKFSKIKAIIKAHSLHAVCEEAHCPNIPECWSNHGTVTFMVMGDICTRNCRFCNVKTGRPEQLDAEEPRKIADAVQEIGLDYVVLTSVDRDDLEDGGAGHFAECIRAIKRQSPKTFVEVLIPDFRGSEPCIKKITTAGADVIAHNIETVKELQEKARDARANYEQSIRVLEFAKKQNKNIFTKTSIMLGLGEVKNEVVEAMRDLKKAGVDILTLGQYLRPSLKHLAVAEYIHPKVFEELKVEAEKMGFLYTASGPFVRSSYRAGELFIKNIKKTDIKNKI